MATGNVSPADNPFTLDVNEGLPIDGNFVNPFEDPDNQTFFEGIHDDNVVIDPDDDENLNFDVIVGQTSFGTLLISGESALRDQDLIIGESGVLNGRERSGTGVVRITGFGSLYNNDPDIIPAGLPTNFASQTPRDPAMGWDLYVGRAGPLAPDVGGTGTLEISAGGRAEIQDAVIVGADVGSVGIILVDGIDSFLGNGGFDGGSAGEPHEMRIGQFGIGSMRITNGGTVVAESAPAGAGGGAEGPVGAVIGSEVFTSARPEPGGQGSVTVSGPASNWVIGGSLQIGGFDEGGSFITGPDLEGDEVEYRSETGRGTLYVEDSAEVVIRGSIGADPEDTELLLMVGRFGRINLNGGQITLGVPTEDDARPDEIQLINDGVISGSGRINTGVFRNRYLGEVRVGAGETLIIDSSSEFTVAGTNVDPLSNFGRVEVFGTVDEVAEIEFERAPNAGATDPLQPFLNQRIPRPAMAPPTDFFGGIITGQHSIMRFRSDIVNTAMIAFTSGDNYVTGNVFNIDPDPVVPDDEGIIFISGPDTKVVFENDLLSTGTLIIEEGADVDIIARHSFVSAGELQVQINPSNFTQISTAGDVGLAGKLSVSLAGFGPGSLSVGDTFEIITAGGGIGGVDLSDPLRPRPDLGVAPSFSELQTPNLTGLGLPQGTFLLPIFTPNSLLLSVVFVPGITLAGDYNNDGVVDAADYIVWRRNAGTMNVLPNDPFGGIIGGTQYNTWRANFGGILGPGAGGGAGVVPEPTGIALLITGSMLALAWGRRRTN